MEREVAQWVHHEESTRRPIASCADVLTKENEKGIITNILCFIIYGIRDRSINSLFVMLTTYVKIVEDKTEICSLR